MKMAFRSIYSQILPPPLLCNLPPIFPKHLFNISFVGLFNISPNNCINLLSIPSTLHSFSSSTDSFSTLPNSDIASPPLPNKLFIQQFLQNSCGLSQKPAILASQALLHLKNTTNAEQVLKFLKECGFTNAHILNLVTRRPRVLASSVRNTLQPKVRILEGLGIVGKQLGGLFVRDPSLLRSSLNKKLLPGISFLQEMLESKENVARVVIREPWLLHTDLEKKLKPKLLFLQNCGIEGEMLAKIFMSKPRSLMSEKNPIEDVVNTVDKLGVPYGSGMFAHAVIVVSSLKKNTVERKINAITSLGLSKEEALLAFRKSPYILAISEEKLQGHMEFLVNTLKYEPSVVVIYPHFFFTSMAARILPRYRVLKMLQSMQLPEKSFSLIDMFCMSEKRFLKRFVFKYGETSGLYEIYKGENDTLSSLALNLKHGESKEKELEQA